MKSLGGFKPCYKWNTFNTRFFEGAGLEVYAVPVLNLVISGIPSILNRRKRI